MLNVLSINRNDHFTLEEANDLMPIIHRITSKHSLEAEKLMQRLENLEESQGDLIQKTEDELHAVVASWEAKVSKLGAEPRGLWLADLDAGDGYFCWKFPEKQIGFWHGYNEGYSNRVPVETRENVRRMRLAFGREFLQDKA